MKIKQMNLKTTKLIKENINKRTHVYQNKISSSNKLNENTPKKQTFHCNYSNNLILKLQQSTHQTQQDFILYY